MATTTKAHDPITPGEILLTEFLEPLGITQYCLARATGLPQTRISEIVRGKRAITTDTAVRLATCGPTEAPERPRDAFPQVRPPSGPAAGTAPLVVRASRASQCAPRRRQPTRASCG